MPTLSWEGKTAVDGLADQPVTQQLVARDHHHALTDGNVLVSGDNLIAQIALRAIFQEQVKLVYMDPPYNTGSTSWVYNDAVGAPEIQSWYHSVVGVQDSSRSDKWLCMMMPRVQAAYQLLREDGILALSIDDSELPHVRLLLDEVFGRKNHIATIVWRTKPAGNDARHISTVHEYIVLYAKDIQHPWFEQRWRIQKPQVAEVQAYAQLLMDDTTLTDEERNEKMAAYHAEKTEEIVQQLLVDHPTMLPGDAKKEAKKLWRVNANYRYFDDDGLYGEFGLGWPSNGTGYQYDVLHPFTGNVCKPPARGWVCIESTMQQRIADNLVAFGPDESKQPMSKIYLDRVETMVPTSLLLDIAGRAGSEELKWTSLGSEFPFAKPTALLQRLIQMLTEPGDIVLDPFAGSGTTGVAVQQLNTQAPSEDAARKCLLIEMESHIEEHITSARLQKTTEGYTTPRGTVIPPLGNPFFRWRLQ